MREVGAAFRRSADRASRRRGLFGGLVGHGVTRLSPSSKVIRHSRTAGTGIHAPLSPNFSPRTGASSRWAEPIRQEKATEHSLGYAQGLRRRGRPARRDPEGGEYRTTGGVKALARCNSIAPHAFPSLSTDIRRAAPILGEKAGLGVAPRPWRRRNVRSRPVSSTPPPGSNHPDNSARKYPRTSSISVPVTAPSGASNPALFGGSLKPDKSFVT